MKQIDTFLSQRFSWYRKWSENTSSSPVHWALFGLIAALAFSIVFTQVTEILVMSDEGSVAVVLAGKRPPLPERSRANIPEPGEVIVTFVPSVAETKRSEVANEMLLKKRGDIEGLNAAVFAIDTEDSAREVADRITHIYRSDVLFAEPNVVIAPEFTPDDPSFSTEWHIPKIGADTAWDEGRGSGMTIAILDTGVDCAHPDLRCGTGWNVVSKNADTADIFGHGTKVAGVAAAVGNNTLGAAGVAYEATIMPVRITNDSQGLATYADIANGIIYAADHGAKVANVSYAAYDSLAITSAAQYLTDRGGVLTMAAGNAGTKSIAKNDPNTVVVSATDMGDARASWSTYGAPVDISAPGLAITTTAPGGGLISMSGTSFSSPIAAGALATLWSRNLSLSNVQVTNALLGTALDFGATSYDEEYGWGRLDLAKAMQAVVSGNIPTVTRQPGSGSQQLSLVSYAVVSKTKDSGVVAWTTNLPASGRVRYGLSTTDLSLVIDATTTSTTQTATVNGLNPRRKYYYQVEAVDATGTTVKSPVTEFRTRSR